MRVGEIGIGPDGVDRRIEIDKGDKVITVWGLYDCHVDNCASDISLLKRTIQVIKDDPTARVVLGGDFNDQMYAPGDPRYDVNNIAPWLLRKVADMNDSKLDQPSRQAYYNDLLLEFNLTLLEPIKEKIDVVISGNHEEKFAKRHTVNVAAMTAKALGIAYFPYEAWLSYYISTAGSVRTSTGHVYHGASGGGPVTGGRIDMTRVVTGWRADWTMRGHNHSNDEGDTGQFERRGAFGNARTFYTPIATVNCPSFEKSYVPGKVTYAKEKHMRPGPLGASTVYLNLEYDETGLLVVPSIKCGIPRA